MPNDSTAPEPPPAGPTPPTERPPRYELRAALPGDEEPLLALAAHLDTVNLPNDRAHVERILRTSAGSFDGSIRERWRRRYVFLVCDREQGTAVGTSSIIGKLGSRDAPYLYFDVFNEEKYHRALDRHFTHVALRLGFSYDGPTELGGLVVHPAHRKAPERLGLLASLLRFAFIATHRAEFEEELLAELLPPLEADGTSHLWEALGRHFTGMSYAEADLLSSLDKEFVRDLFPSIPIYTSVLSPAAQAVIGRVGEQTRGVEKMLRRIGFRYAERVDPFDGGPHFVAATEEVSAIRDTRAGTIRGALGDDTAGARTSLLVRSTAEPPWVRAVPTPVLDHGDGTASAPSAALAHLGLTAGDAATWLPVR